MYLLVFSVFFVLNKIFPDVSVILISTFELVFLFNSMVISPPSKGFGNNVYLIFAKPELEQGPRFVQYP